MTRNEKVSDKFLAVSAFEVLQDDGTLYPVHREIFTKYNMTVLLSAYVECLFGIGADVFAKKNRQAQ